MPWWSWLVIWGALIAALLALLAWQGIRLFRKLMATLAELGDLAEKASVLDENTEHLNERRSGYAVFADAGRLAARRREDVRRRAEARQARRDARVRRGRLLTKADPLQFSHLTKRT